MSCTNLIASSHRNDIFLVQGVGHSVRRFVSQLAIILGPVWGAATLLHPYLMLIVPLTMLVIGTVLYAVSFKKFSSHFF